MEQTNMDLIYREVNTQTGEITERPYTKQELAEVEKNIKRLDAEKAEAEAKAQAKAAAEGKLAALGLTTDDLRALGL
jgi:hypothetical protein